MVEMLKTPLYFLSYVNRRVSYNAKISANDELTVLGFHLKHNLWVEGFDRFVFSDDFKGIVDAPMLVRRAGCDGPNDPEGILNQFDNTALGNLISAIEKIEQANAIAFGFLLLKLNKVLISKINEFLLKILDQARDRKPGDFSTVLDKVDIGLTIHCNDMPIDDAKLILDYHCQVRKYIAKVNVWFGVLLSSDGFLLFVSKLEFPWMASSDLDKKVQKFKPNKVEL